MTIILTVFSTVAFVLLLAFLLFYGKLTASRKKWRKKTDLRIEAHKAFLGSIPKASADEKKALPNVVIILMDDMGWGDISHFGSQAIRTPNIDRLAQRGVTMRNGYSSSPVCSPSRFGLLTGRYPCRGMINGVFFPTENPDKSQLFDMGYRNDGVISGNAPKKSPLKQWMFYSLIRKSMNVSGILPDEVTIPEALQARGYRTGMFGKWHLGDRSPHLPGDKGFDYFFGAHYSNDMCPYHLWRNKEIAERGVIDQKTLTAKLTGELLSFIDKSGDDPFFAYYPSPWPHHPLNAGEDFQGKSKAGLYGDCIQEVDWSVGKIIEKLEESGKLENTLVLFTSDNGPWHQGSPGFHRGRKGNSFDGGQIVPTLAFWPGTLPEGRETHEQVMNIDFFPTILKMAGIPLPEDRAIDGRDILPLLKNEAEKSPHEELYYIYNMAAHGVRTQDHFKYFASQKSENTTYNRINIHPFLFNLDIDPNESYDQRDHFPGKTEELRNRLYNFNREIENNPRGWRQKNERKKRN